MTETKIADLIGLSEIAEMYGVDTNTANGWRRRKDFPRIKHQLRMGPMWDRREIAAWRDPATDPVSQVGRIACQTCGVGASLAILEDTIQLSPGYRDTADLSVQMQCQRCQDIFVVVVKNLGHSYDVHTKEA